MLRSIGRGTVRHVTDEGVREVIVLINKENFLRPIKSHETLWRNLLKG